MSNYLYQRTGGPLIQWGTRAPRSLVAGETRQLSGYPAVTRYGMGGYPAVRSFGDIVTDGVGAKRYPSLQAKVNDHFNGMGSYQAVGRRAGTPEILSDIGSGVSLLVTLAALGAAFWLAGKIMGGGKYKANPARRRPRLARWRKHRWPASKRQRSANIRRRRKLMKRRIRSRARRATKRRTRTYRPAHIIQHHATQPRVVAQAPRGTIRGV